MLCIIIEYMRAPGSRVGDFRRNLVFRLSWMNNPLTSPVRSCSHDKKGLMGNKGRGNRGIRFASHFGDNSDMIKIMRKQSRK